MMTRTTTESAVHPMWTPRLELCKLDLQLANPLRLNQPIFRGIEVQKELGDG
jgi:hypothetical protein